MEIYTGHIMKYLEDRATNINPQNDFKDLLQSKKKLRVKLGVDPTAPDVTLGWYAILRMLKKFQRYLKLIKKLKNLVIINLLS